MDGRKLLFVGEDSVFASCQRALDSYDVACVTSADAALAIAGSARLEAAVVDDRVGVFAGEDLARELRARDPSLPVILLGEPQDRSSLHVRAVPKPAAATDVIREVLRSAEGSPSLPGGYRECLFEAALARVYPVYQPIVSAANRTTVGYEALLRTEQPEFKNPGQLIDLALHLGRMDELGAAVRQRVARDIERAPVGVSIFVNLHASELDASDLLDPSAPLIRHAERVVLEVTERASLDCLSDAQSTFGALRSRGYRLAIDDLGAGYAGLSALAELEPQVCKLDMSVVRNVHLSRAKQRLVRAVAQVAGELEMLLVTEGVETTDERDCLLSLGCDVFQGWLFGKPNREFVPPIWQ